MIILNTTYYIHESIDADFRKWVSEIYFPSAINIGGLERPMLAKILTDTQEGMSGYAVQLSADNKEIAELWHDNHAADLRGELSKLFGDKVLFFNTYMETINP